MKHFEYILMVVVVAAFILVVDSRIHPYLYGFRLPTQLLTLVLSTSLIHYKLRGEINRFNQKWLNFLMHLGLFIIVGVLLWIVFTFAVDISKDDEVTLGLLLIIGVLILLFKFFHPLSARNLRQKEIQEKEYNHLVTITSECRAHRISALIERSKSLIIQSYILLVLIVSVVISVAFFIPLAGEIAGQDATATNAFSLASSRVDRLTSERNMLTNRMDRMSNEISLLTKNVNENEIEINSADISSDDLINKKQTVRIDKQFISDLNERLDVYSVHLNSLKEDIEAAKKLMPTSFRELGDGIKNNSTTRLLVSANVTRFGVLALAIYLVQILINLYRFNSRLAAYYRALVDVITLYDLSKDDVGELVANLSPPFDFGKEPAHLSKQLIEKLTDSIPKIGNTKKDPSKEG